LFCSSICGRFFFFVECISDLNNNSRLYIRKACLRWSMTYNVLLSVGHGICERCKQGKKRWWRWEEDDGDSDVHCWNHHSLDRSEGDLFLVLPMIFSTSTNAIISSAYIWALIVVFSYIFVCRNMINLCKLKFQKREATLAIRLLCEEVICYVCTNASNSVVM
jgi:hypothetical protein